MDQAVYRRRVAVIGGAVGVATAGVIALLVVKGDPEPPDERAPAITFTPPAIPKTLPGAIAKPSAAPTDKASVTAPTDAKAAADAKRVADAAAKKARQDAIEQARNTGILGSTALTQGGAFASLKGTGKDDLDNIYGGLVGTDPGGINGGFGYGSGGFGPGGGTGWGTIGTGRYGTIGRGTGTGRGSVGRSAAVSTLALGTFQIDPTVAGAQDPGALDRAIVRRYIKRNVQRFQDCYEKALAAKPALAGTVTVRFAITESGVVANPTATGVDGDVSSCIAGVLGGIEFPKPKGVGGVTVSTSLTFRKN